MTRWDFSASPLVVVLALASWGVAAWFCWQNWHRRGATRGVGWLEALRLLTLTLIGFTLFKPELVRTRLETERPEVVVLADASGSMKTRDVLTGAGNQVLARDAWLAEVRQAQPWKGLEKQARITVLDFSPPPGAESNNAAEEGTDLNGALEKVLQRQARLKAVLLLSDGDFNLGGSPVSAATKYRARNIPVYTVTVGSETALPDLVLHPVSAPAYGLLGEQVSIPFRIQNLLPREVKTTVSLAAGQNTEARRELTLPAFGEVLDTLIWQPRTLGEQNLKLSIPVVEGEHLTDNNEQNFRIAVRTEQLKVLVIDSLPRWEYRYLRNALERDPGVDVKCLLFHPGLPVGGGTNYLTTFPESKEELSQYDVVFVGDVGLGEGELTGPQIDLLKGLVEQQGSGLIFLPGARGRQSSLLNTALAELLPVQYDPAKPLGIGLSSESSLHLTTAGRGHFLTLLANEENENEEIWKNLPGFYWCAGVLKSRPGSEVLAVHASLRNESGRLPLLVTRPFGSGETLFMGTDSAWRWRRGVEDKYHYRFWGQVVRWMSHKRHLAQGKGVRLVYSPENPRLGENVFLNATVSDSSGLPLDKGPVYATITSPSGKAERQGMELVPGGWGLFKSGFSVREAGRYKVRISSDKGAGALETEIIAARILRERTGQPANAASLREIAELTDGATGGVADVSALIGRIAALPEAKPLEDRIRLWSNPYWAGLLLGLLAIYWTGRKLAGMI